MHPGFGPLFEGIKTHEDTAFEFYGNLIEATPPPSNTIHTHNLILCCPILRVTGRYGRPSHPHLHLLSLHAQSAIMPNIQTNFSTKNPTYFLFHLRTRLQSSAPSHKSSPNHRAAPHVVCTSRCLLNPLRNALTFTASS